METVPHDIQEVLSRLTGVKRNNGYFIASCPVPGHQTAEGHLAVKDMGTRALVKCHGRHSYEEICQALGFDSLTYSHNGDNPHDETRTIVATYDYTDVMGDLLYQVVRYEPKSFSQRRPDGNGGSIYNLKGIEQVLYRLPEVVQAIQEGQRLYICEGEKDADTLHQLGLCGTTAPMGAGKWRECYTQALAGADVVIIPDKDELGRKHAAHVAQSLWGRAKSIKVIELPGPGKDVTDWLAAGGTGEQFLHIIEEAPLYNGITLPTEPTRFHFTRLSELLKDPDEEKAFLWEDTLIKGGLSILVAKPKVGKSTLARNFALALAKGESAFLGRNIAGSGPVLYIALEEKRSEVKKHFERMGATENLPVYIHTGSAPEQAMPELRTAIVESQALLAIVDPLQRMVRMRDLNDYSSVSLVLEELMQIARDTNCHILLIHHANKGMMREGGDSILGSTAIFGSVDCALIMKRNESYRTIESMQRYGVDLPRTVLTFDVATGLTSSGGSLEDVEVDQCKEAIVDLLADHEMAEKEIKEGITDHTGGRVSKSLRLLCQEGTIQREGLGKKGDPFLYATVTRNAGYCGYIYAPHNPQNLRHSMARHRSGRNRQEKHAS
jgi:hypothetical protein